MGVRVIRGVRVSQLHTARRGAAQAGHFVTQRSTSLQGRAIYFAS